jgi:ribosomal protein S18 acetylase RimI-like enzyme
LLFYGSGLEFELKQESRMGGELLRLVQRIWDTFRPWVSKEAWFYRVLFFRNYVRIEEVTERHRQSILDMCAKIYQKTDADRPKFLEYMHRNITRWISEQENIFLSANTADGIIGCINLAVLPNSAAVLESARVVRDRRNQGIASRLASEAISKGLRRANGPLTIRCLVDSDNDDGLGFVRKKLQWNEVAVFRTLEGSARAPIGVAKSRAERIQEEFFEAVASYLECHRSFRGCRALILDGWRPLHLEDVGKFLKENRTYAYIDDDGGVQGIAVARSSLSTIRDQAQEVPVLFAETGEQYKALIHSIQQDPSPLAEARDLLVSFPHDSTVENALAVIRFTQERDHLDLIFEKVYPLNLKA